MSTSTGAQNGSISQARLRGFHDRAYPGTVSLIAATIAGFVGEADGVPIRSGGEHDGGHLLLGDQFVPAGLAFAGVGRLGGG